VINDYFIRNKNKYLEGEEYGMIPRKNLEVKSPILDCFLTRYVYVQLRKFMKKFVTI